MNILLLAASLRQDSTNKKLIRVVTQVEEQQHHAVLADFEQFNTPLYDGDLEAEKGLPAGALNFIKQLKDMDGLILSSPEYNFSVPGTLKNLIDWISRAKPLPWKNLPILLLSASPSLAGGSRGLLHTRVSLEVCGAYVYPKMFSLANSYEAFDEKGQLKDDALQNRLNKIITDFLDFARKLKSEAFSPVIGTLKKSYNYKKEKSLVKLGRF